MSAPDWRRSLAFLKSDGDDLYWDALEMILRLGADGRGVVLSPEECKILLQIVRGERSWPSRPPGRPQTVETLEVKLREKRIAYHTRLLELDGDPTESAVAAAIEFFETSRKHVFECRRRWPGIMDGTLLVSLSDKQRQWFIDRLRTKASKSP